MNAPHVAVLDYGSGNIQSVARALERAGASVEVTSDALRAERALGLVVPGVGAFDACMSGLESVGGPAMIARRLDARQPVLGVCVGMQILFDGGVEHGHRRAGCGRWPGVVEALQSRVVPHMGWNTVEAARGSRMFDGVADARFYFVHSFGVRAQPLAPTLTRTAPAPPRVSWSEHTGDRFVAAVEDGPLWATQFHPEKSADAGDRLLRNWLETLT